MPDYMQGFYDSLSQGVQVAQHLRSAAQQQQQLDETARANHANEEVAGRHAAVAEAAQRDREHQEALTNRLAMLQSGARPVTQGTDGNAYDLNAGGAQVPGMVGVSQGQTQPVDQGRVVSTGGQGYYIPTLDEDFKRVLGNEVRKAGALEQDKLDKYGVSVPDAIADEFKMPRGSKVLLDHAKALADLHKALNPATGEAAPPNLHFVTDDKGNVTGLHPQTGAVVSTQKAIGETEAAKHPRAGGDGGAAPGRKATPGEYASVIQQKASALRGSQRQLDADMKTIEANRAKDLKRVPADRTYKTDEDRVAAVKKAYTDHYARMQDAQNDYEAKLGKLQGSPTDHNSWADDAMANHLQDRAPAGPGATTSGAVGIPSPATPAAGATGTPSGAASAPKTASMDMVKQYAASKKIPLADAIKAAQKDGFTIAGQ